MSRTQVWKCANRMEIGGATKTHGGQYRFTREGGDQWLRVIRTQKHQRQVQHRQRERERRSGNTRYANTGILTIEGIVLDFLVWVRRNGPTVLQKRVRTRMNFLEQIEPIENYIHDVRNSLGMTRVLGADSLERLVQIENGRSLGATAE